MLKQLLLNKRKKGKHEELNALETQRTKLKARSEELAAAIDEAKTDEEIEAVTSEVEQIESDTAGLDEKKSTLEREISAIEAEIAELEKNAPKPPAGDPTPTPDDTRKSNTGGMTRMHANRIFRELPTEQRTALLARDDVKQFLVRTREFLGQKRAVSGADLTIPDVLLGILRDNLHRYSKLINRVTTRPVPGKARQTIAGAIPEAVWTEACASLNELALGFSQVEVDGYMVGGFIPICNATLEDSDLNLMDEIMTALGQGIGLAVDKAILFGTGVKMPVGVATRLAQTSAPSNWGTNAPTWTDLHTSNLLKIDPTGMTAEAFFAALLLKLTVADPKYSNSTMLWVMNTKTKAALMAKAITFNAAGALVAALNNTMPIIGGEIIELPFVADNDIIGGYASLYVLAERAGAQMAVSEHVRFIEGQTVFKGTARYDGLPVFGEGFVMVNIANAAPTTTVLFPQDIANTVATPKALPIAGAYTGSQSVALTCDTAGATIYYTVDGSAPDATKTKYNGPVPVAATATIKAIGIKAGMTNSAVLSATYTIS